VVGGVGSWCELSHGLDGAIGQTRKDVFQVPADGDVEPAAALDHREDGGDLWTGFLAAQVQPVLPAKSYRPHRVLGEVGGELELRILEEQRQLLPQ